VLSLIKAFPEVHFVLERASHGELNRLIRSAPEIRNWSAETSGRFLSHLRQVLDAIGSDRVILGTDMPLQYSKVAILKLESLGLDRASREEIMMLNAARLLKL
jgi:predicted TIM-barrel fold metal-dependent hydrolase